MGALVGISTISVDNNLWPPSFYVRLCAKRALLISSHTTNYDDSPVISALQIMTGFGEAKSFRDYISIDEFDLGKHDFSCMSGREKHCWSGGVLE